MEIDLSITRILEQYDFHSRLYVNCLADIKPKDAQKRINQNTNHIAWLAGNLVSVRYRLGSSIGLKERDTFYEIFKDQRPIQKHITYPDLAPLQEDWNRIAPLLRNRLLSLTEEELIAPQPFAAPLLAKPNLLNTISFLIDREAYAIGQLGLLRKIFGYEAMRYN
ncbi:DinB family protein [Croceitalea rosinachiae]|uniref:DinB family protein n=1 Tax=Croceitalea rosinachiae TaxID=3075596 RepID=A0ABU3AGA5_9FLAO|nr:DinB family protein [Croceitalea sp. F388]MDT0608143.1 DinB family protein [Croceitalea sp. F388]